MDEFIKLVLGDLSIPTYLAAFFFSFLAILVSMRIGATSRDKFSPATPRKFSWYFLFWDNTKRIGTGLILMFLFYRFASAAIGRALSMEVAVGIGFFISMGLDQAIGYFKKKFDFLQVDREKLIDKLNTKQ
jgi:hypothetical protein